MSNVLIIDDEKNICVSLSYALEDEHKVHWVLTPDEAFHYLENQPVDLVLLDLKLGCHDGIQVLKQLKHRHSHIPVIIMTGFGSIDSSVEAVKAGAYHYVSKPIVMDELKNLMGHALENAGLNKQVAHLNQLLKVQNGSSEIIGRSAAMEPVFTMIDKVKNINSTILILGESGTGKDLVAKAIHYSSNRQKHHYEAVNCTAIPFNLLESEFFGHKKGAFTGADSDRKGKFELCHKGTLFLDEIGDMDLSLQAKLLRVMQDKAITPVGSNQSVLVDVRLIAATNKDLKKAVEQGAFREDLYYRLDVITIKVPPLRQRKEDIPFLLQYFIKKYNQQFGKQITGAHRDALFLLERYDFPGNVRELENIAERAVALSEGPVLTLADLPPLEASMAAAAGSAAGTLPPGALAGRRLDDIERQAILDTLRSTAGSRKKAAALLGITERTLRNKLKEYH